MYKDGMIPTPSKTFATSSSNATAKHIMQMKNDAKLNSRIPREKACPSSRAISYMEE